MNESETEYARKELAPYCTGIGLDIGYGGDPIVPWAITVDRSYCKPNRGKYGEDREHLTVSIDEQGLTLPWITDCSMDFVYSSHCLEDFEDTTKVLESWFRVVKPGGLMVLLLPDEQRYRDDCLKYGRQRNLEHIHEDFGMEYLEMCLETLSVPHDIVTKIDPCGTPYSFAVIIQKWQIHK